MAKHVVPKSVPGGFFAWVETRYLDEEKQVWSQRFEKTGCLEYTAHEARRIAEKAHPGRRVKVMGVNLPTDTYVNFKPHKEDPIDYGCFSSRRGWVT